MRKEFLAVVAVATFVLTLLFAVAAGAQEEPTTVPADGNGGGSGIQVQQSQQQQVEVQAEGLVFANGRQSEVVQAAAEGSGALRGEEVEVRSTDDDNAIDLIRIPFPDECTRTGRTISFVLQDEDGTQADFIEGVNVEVSRDGDVLRVTSNDADPPGSDEPDIAPLNERGGNDNLATRNLEVATTTGIRCQDDSSGNNNDNDNSNNDRNTDNDTTTDTNTTTDTTTADTTTADTTTDPAATADAAADDGSGNANGEGSFRCESFLRVVRDENGALRRQYRDGDDEVVVQRFEQCLEADVLAGTIPDGRLPFTGGPSLPLGGGVLLLVAAAVLVERMIRR